MSKSLKFAFVALLASVLATILLFDSNGSLSYVLLPGVYLSAFLTVKDHAAFGTAYFLVGLAINAILLLLVTLALRRVFTWARNQKAK